MRFCSLCGFPINSVTQTLLFVLIGIGLDDAFVLVAASKHTDQRVPLEVRLKNLRQPECHCDQSDGLFGGCLWCMVHHNSFDQDLWFLCLHGDCNRVIWQITFFLSILAIDQRRMMRGYRDFCCCLEAKVLEDDLRLNKPATASN